MRSNHLFAPPVLATAMAGPEQDPPVEVVEEPEPESGKPKVDLAGLASELEQLESVRTHLRETKGPLFDPDENPESIRRVEKDHAYDIMKVILGRVAIAEGHPSSGVKALRSELATLYQNCSVVTDDSTVHTDAWFVRKIVSFVKMKVRRAKVSTVTHLK